MSEKLRIPIVVTALSALVAFVFVASSGRLPWAAAFFALLPSLGAGMLAMPLLPVLKGRPLAVLCVTAILLGTVPFLGGVVSSLLASPKLASRAMVFPSLLGMPIFAMALAEVLIQRGWWKALADDDGWRRTLLDGALVAVLMPFQVWHAMSLPFAAISFVILFFTTLVTTGAIWILVLPIFATFRWALASGDPGAVGPPPQSSPVD